jgi:hypothetical protein
MGIKIKITEEEILAITNDIQLGSYIRKKYIIQKERMNKDVDILSLGQIPDDEPEVCLFCGKFSPYSKSTHIDLRVGYVRGAGQGCFSPEKCLKKNK